jgi:hypothetical protein
MVNFELSNDITIDIKSIPLSEEPFQIEVHVLSFGFQVRTAYRQELFEQGNQHDTVNYLYRHL